jgi:hypothetical protein
LISIFSSALLVVILPTGAMQEGAASAGIISILIIRLGLLRLLPLMTRFFSILSAFVIKVMETRMKRR